MIAPMPGDADYDASYFAGGRVSAAGMEKLFTACRFLFEVEPWTVVDDQQVLRMDIPALDVRAGAGPLPRLRQSTPGPAMSLPA